MLKAQEEIPMPTPEDNIVRVIEDGLTYMGAVVLRMRNVPVPIRRGNAIVGLRRAHPSTDGMADLLVIFPPDGTTVWIEAKQPGRYQQPNQKEFERRVKAAGGRYIVAHGWEDVVGQLAPVLTAANKVKGKRV